MSGKTPTPGHDEYLNRVDRRRRPVERALTAPFIDSNNFEPSSRHGKVHQVQFKISPFAEKTGSEVAALFGMSLSQYCKAVLYLNLGLVFDESGIRTRCGSNVVFSLKFWTTTRFSVSQMFLFQFFQEQEHKRLRTS
jgi:hypothetical protein